MKKLLSIFSYFSVSMSSCLILLQETKMTLNKINAERRRMLQTRRQAIARLLNRDQRQANRLGQADQLLAQADQIGQADQLEEVNLLAQAMVATTQGLALLVNIALQEVNEARAQAAVAAEEAQAAVDAQEQVQIAENALLQTKTAVSNASNNALRAQEQLATAIAEVERGAEAAMALAQLELAQQEAQLVQTALTTAQAAVTEATTDAEKATTQAAQAEHFIAQALQAKQRTQVAVERFLNLQFANENNN